MIVIVIIGVVYALAIKSLHKYSNKSKNLTLQTLPEYMDSIHGSDNLKLICIDNCHTCLQFRNGDFEKQIDSFLSEDVKVYRYDINLGAKAIEFAPFFDKEKREFDVCFKYEISAEGVRDDIAVEDKAKVYALPSYFGKVKKYDTIEDYIDDASKQRQKAYD